MHSSWNRESDEQPLSSVGGPHRPLRLDKVTVFRAMITSELQSGRLTPARRARIVRYAAQMGLSAVEAGQLVAACREEALQSDDDRVRHYALRLVEPLEPRIPTHVKIGAVILLALMADLLLARWLW